MVYLGILDGSGDVWGVRVPRPSRRQRRRINPRGSHRRCDQRRARVDRAPYGEGDRDPRAARARSDHA